jgi:hypothetical protein
MQTRKLVKDINNIEKDLTKLDKLAIIRTIVAILSFVTQLTVLIHLLGL